jgi:uncharacterized phage protein (TIGR02218 family)
MRQVTPAFAQMLQSNRLTLCCCVRVTRLDGVVFGFTTLDQDIVYNGVTYEARAAFQSSAIRAELTQGIDNLNLIGLLSSDRITAEDIEAGRYDGASIVIFLLNWQDVTQGILTLLTGTLGELSLLETQYAAELLSLVRKLSQQIGDLVSKSCVVQQLGDHRCAPAGTFGNGRALSDYQFQGTVASVDAADTISFTAVTPPDADYFAYGKVTLLVGQNTGIAKEVKAQLKPGPNPQLQLQEAFPFPLSVGDAVQLEAGCIRLSSMCSAKFGNIANYQGFPFVPGPEALTLRGR